MKGFSATPIDIVRVGFIGLGYRGKLAVDRYTRLPHCRIAALCDVSEDAVASIRGHIDYSRGVSEYHGQEGWKRLCENPSIDLVYICTAWQTHTDMACYAMECGKHVAIEVPAATSVEECWRLVRTAEKTRRHCMMLENCIYDTFEASVYNMVQDGVFGEVYHAEGGYIHNIPDLNDWRVDFNRVRLGDNYPTHGLGPLCRLMGIHRTDYLDTITSFRTPCAKGSHVASVIRTRNGKSIILQHNIYAARPYSRLFQITGDKGFASKYPVEQISLLPDTDSWLSESELRALVEKYTPDYYSQVREIFPKDLEPKRFMDHAMDYRLLHCLHNGLPLDMDVYDAAEWSCISELSHMSISNGSAPVAFPDFLCDRNLKDECS